MHPKAYAIVEKESGKIEQIFMTRFQARESLNLNYFPSEYRIIPVEIRKLKK